MHPFAKAALGAAAAAYANHTFVKPTRIAKLARSFANGVGKPMLTFIPPAGATLKSIFTTPLAIGDVNLHHNAKTAASGPGQIGRGIPYRVPVAPRTFGCVFSCDVLEHLDRPDLALLEWHRVADRVFLVVPPWWTPEAWLSKWYIDAEAKRAWPVWVQQSRVIWLPSEPRRAYAAGTCPTPPRRLASPMATASQSSRPSQPESVQDPPGPDSNESVRRAPSAAASLPIVNLLPPPTSPTEENEDYTTEDTLPSSASPSDMPYLPPVVGSPSSTSVSSMMIVSGPDHESD